LRRLAAIGAADVPSYFWPVEADRERTLARLTGLHRYLIDRQIALQRGRTLETGAVHATPTAAG
jgi:hypothetical protein